MGCQKKSFLRLISRLLTFFDKKLPPKKGLAYQGKDLNLINIEVQIPFDYSWEKLLPSPTKKAGLEKLPLQ